MLLEYGFGNYEEIRLQHTGANAEEDFDFHGSLLITGGATFW